MQQRGGAELDPLRHSGGPRRGHHHRRTFGHSLFLARTERGDSVRPLHAVRGQRLHQRVQPGPREPGVDRGDGRPAAVERRGQQLEQPRPGAVDQDRTQRVVRHDR